MQRYDGLADAGGHTARTVQQVVGILCVGEVHEDAVSLCAHAHLIRGQVCHHAVLEALTLSVGKNPPFSAFLIPLFKRLLTPPASSMKINYKAEFSLTADLKAIRHVKRVKN